MTNDVLEEPAEYLLLFPPEGLFEVSVKFKKSEAWIQKRRASATDVANLLDTLTRLPKPVMLFDNYFGIVDAVRVDPAKHTVRLEVSMQS